MSEDYYLNQPVCTSQQVFQKMLKICPNAPLSLAPRITEKINITLHSNFLLAKEDKEGVRASVEEISNKIIKTELRYLGYIS